MLNPVRLEPFHHKHINPEAISMSHKKLFFISALILNTIVFGRVIHVQTGEILSAAQIILERRIVGELL